MPQAQVPKGAASTGVARGRVVDAALWDVFFGRRSIVLPPTPDMTTWTALTTLPGEPAAVALGEALEALDPAPTGLGVFEVEDGSGDWEVGGYYTDRPDPVALDILAAAHGARPFAISRVPNTDWVAQVRRELSPIHAGRFTVYGAHDAERIGPHRLGLRIEAAMAFGTGHHGTTQGCLVLFDRLLRQGRRPRRVADIGCGTGVLAMAAAKALRAPAVATDIDAVAAATARENARINGLYPWIATGIAAGFRHPRTARIAPYDLIFANILARPLMALAPQIRRHLSRRGRVILSGLLVEQAAAVEAVFRCHGLIRRDRVRIGGWESVVLGRH